MERHANDPFQVLTIDALDPREGFAERCAEAGITWPVIFQGEPMALSHRFGVSFYPTVYVLDRDGVIRAVNPRGAALERIVAELLAAR